MEHVVKVAVSFFRRLNAALGGLENRDSGRVAERGAIDALVREADVLSGELARRLPALRAELSVTRQRAESARTRAVQLGERDERSALVCLAEARADDDRCDVIEIRIAETIERISSLSERQAELRDQAIRVALEEERSIEQSDADRCERAIRDHYAAVDEVRRADAGAKDRGDPTAATSNGDTVPLANEDALREELRSLLTVHYRSFTGRAGRRS